MVKRYFDELLILINDFLFKEYGGRSIKDWLLLVFGYSVVIWFIILGFLAYDFYENYKKLKEMEETKLNILRGKRQQIAYIKNQIKEIRKAYNILKNYFAPSQVAPLKRALQKEFINQQEKLKNWQYFASEKYTFPKGENFLVKENVPVYKFQFHGLQILDKTMVQFYDFYRQLQSINIKIRGDINLTKLNNYYVLYFNPGQGNRITLKTYKYYGYIKDIFKSKIPLEGSYFDQKQIRLNNYSKLFFAGWNLELSEGGF